MGSPSLHALATVTQSQGPASLQGSWEMLVPMFSGRRVAGVYGQGLQVGEIAAFSDVKVAETLQSRVGLCGEIYFCLFPLQKW